MACDVTAEADAKDLGFFITFGTQYFSFSRSPFSLWLKLENANVLQLFSFCSYRNAKWDKGLLLLEQVYCSLRGMSSRSPAHWKPSALSAAIAWAVLFISSFQKRNVLLSSYLLRKGSYPMLYAWVAAEVVRECTFFCFCLFCLHFIVEIKASFKRTGLCLM